MSSLAQSQLARSMVTISEDLRRWQGGRASAPVRALCASAVQFAVRHTCRRLAPPGMGTGGRRGLAAAPCAMRQDGMAPEMRRARCRRADAGCAHRTPLVARRQPSQPAACPCSRSAVQPGQPDPFRRFSDSGPGASCAMRQDADARTRMQTYAQRERALSRTSKACEQSQPCA